jgi:hypothetical protein
VARGRPAGAESGLTTELETLARLAGAIVLETMALAVWNVGTRAPARALRDVVRSLNNRRALLTGTLSLFVGLVFVAAATILLLPTVTDVRTDFVPIEVFTFLTALALEYLIGNDLRAFIARVGGSGTPRPS